MLRSLVGSEMCIRDRLHPAMSSVSRRRAAGAQWGEDVVRVDVEAHLVVRLFRLSHSFHDACKQQLEGAGDQPEACPEELYREVGESLRLSACVAPAPPYSALIPCLLYTSDAADEEDSVDLGGRRIIKKKKTKKNIWRCDV
eukprot:TRINITY_DN19554_c0_g1_i4.p1 TRINITY_DN19554_c0_g1~~TRINITY_DN19554_c0_g1_i4.p1  ORF type:complete len:142 (-),score=34.63 TRINITY_DN19554_c0_g1_i4:37-462(-)